MYFNALLIFSTATYWHYLSNHNLCHPHPSLREGPLSEHVDYRPTARFVASVTNKDSKKSTTHSPKNPIRCGNKRCNTSVLVPKVKGVVTKPSAAVKIDGAASTKKSTPEHRRKKLVQEKADYVEKYRFGVKYEQMKRKIATNLQSTNSKRAQIEDRLLNEVAPRTMKNLQELDRERRGKVKVIVVGAGLAGLSAAHRLITAGFSDVIVLEAQRR